MTNLLPVGKEKLNSLNSAAAWLTVRVVALPALVEILADGMVTLMVQGQARSAMKSRALVQAIAKPVDGGGLGHGDDGFWRG